MPSGGLIDELERLESRLNEIQELRDEGSILSDEALDWAERNVEEIRRQYHDIRVVLRGDDDA